MKNISGKFISSVAILAIFLLAHLSLMSVMLFATIGANQVYEMSFDEISQIPQSNVIVNLGETFIMLVIDIAYLVLQSFIILASISALMWVYSEEVAAVIEHVSSRIRDTL